MVTQAKVLVDGRARGEILHLQKDLSFWGAINPLSGQVIDRRHPQFEQNISGRILLIRRSVGSSSGSAILMETLYRGCGPAGIILGEPDQILTLGAVVAREMEYAAIPVLQLDVSYFPGLRGLVRIEKGGHVSRLGESC